MKSPIGCAVIGYGPQHNFGWAHSAWIDATPDLRLVGVCDLNPARTEAAKEAFPSIRTYNDLADVWVDPEIELVSIVTPHYTHCPIAVAALQAGKHVVVEKAMCLNVAEATAMVEAGRQAGKMLAVHHNRRHDGNYRLIEEIVKNGSIGEVFHIELSAGGFGQPKLEWYTEKAKSGGGFFYWGPHAVDWVLNLIPSPIVGVNGFFHKLVWRSMTNEDQTRAIIRFANGCVADVLWSHIAAVGKPLWRLLGTEGGVLDTGAGGNVGYEKMISGPSGGSLKLVKCGSDGRTEADVAYKDSDWPTYWQEVADHLLRSGPVPVSGEFGRRVIGVFEAAEKSSATGQTEPVAYEEEYWSGRA
ncbi:MAG: Gfo/Idh/MocA family protein [Bacteroidota bacterium]